MTTPTHAGRPRLRNLPVPESYVAGIAVGVLLQRLRPLRLPGRATAHRLFGGALLAGGAWVIGRATDAAHATDLDSPGRLVTSGPYSVSRNPMYAGWALLHLGAALTARSPWILATLPAAATWVHQEVITEERRLAARFGDEYDRYRAAVPRYVRLAGRASTLDARPD